MIRVRGLAFADEDDAYEYFRQRDVDDEAEAARWPFPQLELGLVKELCS